MVVEHSFVTTLPESAAFERACSFLQARGFTPIQSPVVSPSTAPLEFRRGKTNPARARSVSELPQTVRVEFDRGRVSIAASITPSAHWGGSSFTQNELTTKQADITNPKRMKLHTDMLMGVVLGLEALIGRGVSEESAAQLWLVAERQIALAAHRRKRRNAIVLAGLVVFISAIIGLTIYAVRH